MTNNFTYDLRVVKIVLSLFIFSFLPCSLWAYPSFIGYGYKSCVTCHYNGQGGGALNDYGKALFAAEIASRSLYGGKITAEELGEQSGFPGQSHLPNWYRPGFKFRALWFQTDPGSASAKSRVIPMQLDFSNAILFDESQKWVAVATIGYMPIPKALENTSGPIEKPSNVISREYYVRWNPQREWFGYLGLMDKVFGIRTNDHTAFSRIKTGLAMNDQSHGATVMYVIPTWEFTLNPFIGDLGQASDLRQKGISAMIEKDLAEKHRIGGALLTSENNYLRWLRAEIHSKLGFGDGNSFLAEGGVIQDQPKGDKAVLGAYVFVEGLAQFTRGYSLMSQIEYYNKTMSPLSPDQIKWSFGLLMFPAPRFEVRTTLVNSRTQSDSGVSADGWQAQVQLHVAL